MSFRFLLWMAFLGIIAYFIHPLPWYAYISHLLNAKIVYEMGSILAQSAYREKWQIRSSVIRYSHHIFIISLILLKGFIDPMTETPVLRWQAMAIVMILSLIHIDGFSVIIYLLKRAMKKNDLKRSAALAKDLINVLFSEVANPKSKMTKRKHIRFSKAISLLGEYREAIMDYKLAAEFYHWAGTELIKSATRGNRTAINNNTEKACRLFSKCIVLFDSFNPGKAKALRADLERLIPFLRNPNTISACLVAGLRHPTIGESMKQNYGTDITGLLLQKRAAPLLEFTGLPVTLDHSRAAYELARCYIQNGMRKEAIVVLDKLTKQLADKDDMRGFLLRLDASKMQARELAGTGQQAAAFTSLTELFPVIDNKISSLAALSNEYALLGLSEKVNHLTRLLLQICVDHFTDDAFRCQIAFEIFQKYKSMSVELRLQVQQFMTTLEKEADIKTAEKVVELRSKLSAGWSRSSDFKPELFLVDRTEIEEIESYIIKGSDKFGKYYSIEACSLPEVREAMSSNERFFQVIRLESEFAALLLDKNPPLRICTIGSISDWEKYIESWRNLVAAGISPGPDRKSVSFIQDNLIKALLVNSATYERLLISAEDVISLLPFEALYHPDSGRLLLEEFEIIYTDNAKDIIKRHTPVKTFATDPVVFSSPDFSCSNNDENELIQVFNELPGAKKEGELIASLLSASHFAGSRATVPNLKKIKKPSVLHIATHGISTDDVFEEGLLKSLNLFDDPMIRTALVMAGINMINSGIKVNKEEFDDGLFTAFEALALDMRGTGLVVLSACNTGLGSFHTGEGVLGLRRAFKIAGARSVICSLWKADDDVTCTLMKSFYENLIKGETVSKALRKAKLDIVRRKPAPYYWALFICYGFGTEPVKI